MPLADLSGGAGQAAQALSQLTLRWQEIKTQWNDENRRQFQEEHLDEIPAKLRLLLNAAQRLSEVLNKAERDCDDQPNFS